MLALCRCGSHQGAVVGSRARKCCSVVSGDVSCTGAALSAPIIPAVAQVATRVAGKQHGGARLLRGDRPERERASRQPGRNPVRLGRGGFADGRPVAADFPGRRIARRGKRAYAFIRPVPGWPSMTYGRSREHTDVDAGGRWVRRCRDRGAWFSLNVLTTSSARATRRQRAS
jgi:hypothetical protein